MGDYIKGVKVGGSVGNIGSGGVTSNYYDAPAKEDPAAAPGPPGQPQHGLCAFADIVGYSRFSARLQRESQDYLVSLLEDSQAAAGVQPGQVTPQDQGDARLLWFVPGTDTAKILAVMPRYFHDHLLARNQDMAPHAAMRVRVSFAMGATALGSTGLIGAVPITASRLANWPVFQRVMKAEPRVQCGVIIDGHLHSEYVRQGFRAEIDQDAYVPVHVSDPGKGFEAKAWLQLLGLTGQEVT